MVPFGRTRYQLQICRGCALARRCGKPEASSCAPVMKGYAFHSVSRIGAGVPECREDYLRGAAASRWKW